MTDKKKPSILGFISGFSSFIKFLIIALICFVVFYFIYAVIWPILRALGSVLGVATDSLSSVTNGLNNVVKTGTSSTEKATDAIAKISELPIGDLEDMVGSFGFGF